MKMKMERETRMTRPIRGGEAASKASTRGTSAKSYITIVYGIIFAPFEQHNLLLEDIIVTLARVVIYYVVASSANDCRGSSGGS